MLLLPLISSAHFGILVSLDLVLMKLYEPKMNRRSVLNCQAQTHPFENSNTQKCGRFHMHSPLIFGEQLFMSLREGQRRFLARVL